MTVRDWESQHVHRFLQGQETPTLNEIILSVVPSEEAIKREELITHVAVATGISQEDLSKNINHNLKSLCKEGVLTRGKLHGFYCRQRSA